VGGSNCLEGSNPSLSAPDKSVQSRANPCKDASFAPGQLSSPHEQSMWRHMDSDAVTEGPGRARRTAGSSAEGRTTWKAARRSEGVSGWSARRLVRPRDVRRRFVPIPVTEGGKAVGPNAEEWGRVMEIAQELDLIVSLPNAGFELK